MIEGCVQSVIFSCGSTHFPAHTHNNYQLIFIKKGCAQLKVACREYSASAPCLIFISNLEQHSFEILSDAYERYTINIEPEKANQIIKNQTLLSIFSNRPAQFCHVISVEPIKQKVEDLVEMLYEEASNGYLENSEVGSLFIKILLITLNRYKPDAFPTVNSGIANTIRAVKKDIEDHLEIDITLKEIALKYNISQHYLAHSFKKITGYSIKQYQLLCRLSLARELLTTTDINITEVCHKSGFSDMSNFSRYFRRQMGVTPSSYRKQYLEKMYR